MPKGGWAGDLSEKQLRRRTCRAAPDFILSAGPFGTLFLNHKTLLQSLLGSLTCRRDERRTWPSRGAGAEDTPGHPPHPGSQTLRVHGALRMHGRRQEEPHEECRQQTSQSDSLGSNYVKFKKLLFY